MDGHRFDELARSLSRGVSRRRVLGGLAGAVLGTVGLRSARADWTDNPLFGAVDWTGFYCGGDAAVACPTGYDCVDDPNDDCDPATGGVECATVCMPAAPSAGCAAILCEEGSACCENCGGICVPIGTVCSDELCGEPCNAVTCAAGEFCCNESCSICAPSGGVCTQEFCG